jgi:hypothetical protein
VYFPRLLAAVLRVVSFLLPNRRRHSKQWTYSALKLSRSDEELAESLLLVDLTKALMHMSCFLVLVDAIF